MDSSQRRIVNWRRIADDLYYAINLRDRFSQHSVSCKTCRDDRDIDSCQEGRPLYDRAMQATMEAIAAYTLAEES